MSDILPGDVERALAEAIARYYGYAFPGSSSWDLAGALKESVWALVEQARQEGREDEQQAQMDRENGWGL